MKVKWSWDKKSVGIQKYGIKFGKWEISKGKKKT